MLRVAAVPLIQPHDIHALLERLGCEATHVVRVAGSIQAVERQQRRVPLRLRLPMTRGGHARAWRDVEEAARRRRQPWEIARVAPAVNRHRVTAAEHWPRDERVVMLTVADNRAHSSSIIIGRCESR